jgi:hypothetical protein
MRETAMVRKRRLAALLPLLEFYLPHCGVSTSDYRSAISDYGRVVCVVDTKRPSAGAISAGSDEEDI